MFQRVHALQAAFWLTAAVGFTGCAGMNRLGTKLDMAAGHLSHQGTPAYQGQLQAIRPIGDMTALQFTDGKFYDVSEAPLALEPGDVVRIYKTDKGYEAHLWREND